VEPGMHVGVAGRTGSGKSTTLLSLMRMYEVESGSVWIDGVDISNIGLHTLRATLGIIPQDPVIFGGSLRENIDPFNDHEDLELIDALRKVQLRPPASWLGGESEAKERKEENSVEDDRGPAELPDVLTVQGANLSAGQRQLLCIARAIVKRPKILLLDEATSSIDEATDRLIQKVLREEFASTTMITIAHRLNTIMDSDKILVIEEGVCVCVYVCVCVCVCVCSEGSTAL
jgi:ABC-type multidrug transport system fused ATPase/permease subunit